MTTKWSQKPRLQWVVPLYLGVRHDHEVQPPKLAVAGTKPLKGGAAMAILNQTANLWLGLGRPTKDGARPFGPTQLAVLQSIHDDPEKAYAVGIAQRLSKDGKRVTDGNVVASLHRLERDGLIETVTHDMRHSNPPAKMGRPRKHYRITQSGLGVLNELSGRSAGHQTANPETEKGFSHEAASLPPGKASLV